MLGIASVTFAVFSGVFTQQSAPQIQISGLIDGAKLAADFNTAKNETRLLFLFSPS